MKIDPLPRSVFSFTHIPSIKDWEHNLTFLAKLTQLLYETSTFWPRPWREVISAGMAGVAGVLGESNTVRSGLLKDLD